jgi:hypothetical protein
LGHGVFEELRNDHIAIQADADELEHLFYVTLNQRDSGSVPLPSPSMRVLNPRLKPKTFKKKIIACDWFILDLMGAALSGGLDDIESIIKIIKDFHTSQSSTAESKE